MPWPLDGKTFMPEVCLTKHLSRPAAPGRPNGLSAAESAGKRLGSTAEPDRQNQGKIIPIICMEPVFRPLQSADSKKRWPAQDTLTMRLRRVDDGMERQKLESDGLGRLKFSKNVFSVRAFSGPVFSSHVFLCPTFHEPSGAVQVAGSEDK
jgi:hypothetical protein